MSQSLLISIIFIVYRISLINDKHAYYSYQYKNPHINSGFERSEAEEWLTSNKSSWKHVAIKELLNFLHISERSRSVTLLLIEPTLGPWFATVERRASRRFGISIREHRLLLFRCMDLLCGIAEQRSTELQHRQNRLENEQRGQSTSNVNVGASSTVSGGNVQMQATSIKSNERVHALRLYQIMHLKKRCNGMQAWLQFINVNQGDEHSMNERMERLHRMFTCTTLIRSQLKRKILYQLPIFPPKIKYVIYFQISNVVCKVMQILL